MADDDAILQSLIQNLADVFDLKKEDLGSEFRITVLRHAAQALGALDEEEEELEDDKVPLLFCSYCLGIDLNCVLAFDRRIVSEVDITVGGSVNNLVSVFACR